MSGKLVREVLENAPADLTKQELLVLVSIAESAFEKDRVARQQSSADAIAIRIRSTPSSVRNTLTALRARALIVPMIEHAGRGRAQQWYLPKLTPNHRGVMLRDDLQSEVFARHTASPDDDANPAAPASHPDDAKARANGARSRHSQMTPDPVENPDPAESIASPGPLEQRHPQVAAPVKATPVNHLVRGNHQAQVVTPADSDADDVAPDDDDPFAITGAELAHAALRNARRDR